MYIYIHTCITDWLGLGLKCEGRAIAKQSLFYLFLRIIEKHKQHSHKIIHNI